MKDVSQETWNEYKSVLSNLVLNIENLEYTIERNPIPDDIATVLRNDIKILQKVMSLVKTRSKQGIEDLENKGDN